MAGCSSSVAIAHFKNLENAVVSKSLLATRFRCCSMTGTRRNRRLICERQRLVVVNVINPETKSKSSPPVTTTIETGDIDCVEKDAAKGVDKSYLSIPDSKNDDGGGGGGFTDGSGGNGKFSGGGGGGGGGDDGGDDYEEKEFGPLLKFEEVIR